MNKILKASKFILIFCLFLLIASGTIESIDGMSSLNIARTMIDKRAFVASPPAWNTGMQVIKGKDGQYYSPVSIGSAIALLPSTVISRVIYKLNHFHAGQYFPLQPDYLLTFLASFTNPFLGFLLFIIDYKIFSLFLKKKSTAFLLSFVVSFSTNLLPLSKHAFSHVLYILLLMSSVYYLLLYFKKEDKAKYLTLSGVFIGLSILSYNMVSLVVLFPYVLFFFFALRNRYKKESLNFIFSKIVLWFIAVVPFILILLGYNYIRFGSFFNSGYDINSFDIKTNGVFFEGLWGLLFSPGRSFIVYSPILLAAYILAIKNFKKDIYSQFFIILSLLVLIFYSRFVFWNGELSWGPRYLALLIPFGGIILAEYWDEINKLFLVSLIVLGLFIQFEGIVIPYQTQYPPYDLPVFSLPKNLDRSTQFAYWSLGEFIPRYAPIYRLKKVLVTQLKELPIILNSHDTIHFAKNVSLPIQKSDRSYYKHALSAFYIYTKNTISPQQLTMNISNINQIITHAIFCVEQECIPSQEVKNNGTSYIVTWNKPITIASNIYAKVIFYSNNPKIKNFEFDINSFSLGENSLSMKSYRLPNQDSFFSRGTPLFYNGSDLKNYWSQRDVDQAIFNMTPDFWWVKTHIYFNLPPYFNSGYYMIVTILFFSGIVVLIDSYKNRKGKKLI